MDEKEIKVLIFGIENEYYATDIRDVERILEFNKTTPMPDAPDFIEGVINNQDEILPIVNIQKKFKLKLDESSTDRKIISIKREEKQFGVVVDHVYEVRDIKSEIIDEVPTITKTSNDKYIKGLIKLDGKIIILLNLSDILTEEEENVIFSDN